MTRTEFSKRTKVIASMSEAQTEQALRAPWRVESDNLSYVSDNNGDPVCDCYSAEIASRIVACVNACAGVPHLEPGILKEMREMLRPIADAAKDVPRALPIDARQAVWFTVAEMQLVAAILARLEGKQ